MKSYIEINFKVPNPIAIYITKRRWKRYAKRWNSSIKFIDTLIALNPEIKNNTEFYWYQLVKQEIKMWIAQEDPKKPKEEMNYLCERRGFNTLQRIFLEEMMDYLGMYK